MWERERQKTLNTEQILNPIPPFMPKTADCLLCWLWLTSVSKTSINIYFIDAHTFFFQVQFTLHFHYLLFTLTHNYILFMKSTLIGCQRSICNHHFITWLAPLLYIYILSCQFCICIYPPRLWQAGCTTRPIFKQSEAGLNSFCPSLRLAV